MNQVGKIFWLVGCKDLVRHQSDLVLDSVLDLQPVKTSQYWRDVFGSAGVNHRAGQRILETLKLIDVALGIPVEDTVAVIDASSNQSTGDGPQVQTKLFPCPATHIHPRSSCFAFIPYPTTSIVLTPRRKFTQEWQLLFCNKETILTKETKQF